MISRWGVLLALLVSVATPLAAQAQTAEPETKIDPRFSYAFELTPGIGYFGSFSGTSGRSCLVYEGAAAFMLPVRENRQLELMLRAGGNNTSEGFVRFGTVSAQYRMMRDFDAFQTRLDIGVGADLARITNVTDPHMQGPYFALAALFNFALLYRLSDGWRVGLDLGGGFYVIHLRVQAEVSPTVTYSW